MKNLFFICFYFTFLFSIAQQAVKIGMSLDDVKALYPQVKETKYMDKITLERDEVIHGLADKWTYTFEEGKLRSMQFYYYRVKRKEL
jgi:hypothetical protein